MIKEVMEKDIEECVNLIRSSFLTVAEQFGFTSENAPRFTAFATTEQRLIWQLKQERRPMYGFFDEERIVGYYSLQMSEEGICELNNLCVSPEYRHKGIGDGQHNRSQKKGRRNDCYKKQTGLGDKLSSFCSLCHSSSISFP